MQHPHRRPWALPRPRKRARHTPRSHAGPFDGPRYLGGEEDEGIVCNHLIAMQTNLVNLTWSALDFSTDPPAQRTFKVEFEEDETAAEFKDLFEEGKIVVQPDVYNLNTTSGKELAEQSEILETVGDQDPQDFYYGQGADGE